MIITYNCAVVRISKTCKKMQRNAQGSCFSLAISVLEIALEIALKIALKIALEIAIDYAAFYVLNNTPTCLGCCLFKRVYTVIDNLLKLVDMIKRLTSIINIVWKYVRIAFVFNNIVVVGYTTTYQHDNDSNYNKNHEHSKYHRHRHGFFKKMFSLLI